MMLLLAAMLATLAPATAEPPLPQAPAKAFFAPSETRSSGSVDVGGRRIAYQSVAGTLVVHSKGWEDTDAIETAVNGADKDDKDSDKPKAEASMFYTAYFRDRAPNRPITFLFNGGPGSSTVWLHMGAFGPVRV